MDKEQIYQQMLSVVATTGLSVEEAYRELVNGFSSWYLTSLSRDSNRNKINKMKFSDALK